MKGTVASGHPLTGRAAIEMFKSGGNAFDAIVSAGFASVVTEPTLTSLGGGGFLLTHSEEEKRDTLFDFFVNTPGLNNGNTMKPDMKPVNITFPGCTQIFHVGFGSVAVPGMLKGLLYIHKRICTLPLKTILGPALTYLREGVEINEKQETFMNYLKPIFTLHDYGRQIYMMNGRYLKKSDRIYNYQLKVFLERIIDYGDDIYSGEIAENLITAIKECNGLLSIADLASYKVIERQPLRIQYRDREIITNPPPSFGGTMLALSLKLLETFRISGLRRNSEKYFIQFIELLKSIDIFRKEKKGNWIEEMNYPFVETVISPLLQAYRESVTEKTCTSTQGTTHISVIDEKGNAASMTTSNGSGSGCFVPETGIMLNNMMGEDDLHPDGFFTLSSGKRVSSMMAPTIVMKKGRVETALGSGGSKRIRTAILQVLINLIDFQYPLKEAIEAPRIHYEDGVIQAEPDSYGEVLEILKRHYTINVWESRNMYFGGVHAVRAGVDGWGDSRRDGNVLIY
ncbi:MAG: gamma-glutamyltransferase [Nitrospiraceae bacterium]|nr:MAG: gamma-glutamyltransferase [Nitrospiraceae bacterium]